MQGQPTDKPAAWLDLERGPAIGRLIVWVSGEASLAVGQDGEEVAEEHLQLAAIGDLRVASCTVAGLSTS